MKKMIVVGILVAVMVVGGFFFFYKEKITSQLIQSTENQMGFVKKGKKPGSPVNLPDKIKKTKLIIKVKVRKGEKE